MLLKEYELHRNESIKHLEFHNTQTTHIQVFLGALIAVVIALGSFNVRQFNDSPTTPGQSVHTNVLGSPTATLLSSHNPTGTVRDILSEGSKQTQQLQAPEPKLMFILLLAGLIITGYFITGTISLHYTLQVLRRRMREIEQALERLLQCRTIDYESSTVPRFISPTFIRYEKDSPSLFERWAQPILYSPQFNPVKHPFLLRTLLILLVMPLLLLISTWTLPIAWRAFYVAGLLTFSLWLILLFLRHVLEIPAGAHFSDITATTPSSWFQNLAGYVPSILVIALIVSAPYVPGLNLVPVIGDLERWRIDLAANPVKGYLLGCTVYSLLAYLPFPIPSELPMVLVPSLGFWPVLVFAALGRALSAFLQVKLLSIPSARINSWISSRVNWFTPFISKHGFLLFLATQAIPFAPLRTGFLSYVLVEKSHWKIVGGAALGSAFRNASMYFAVASGFIPLHRFLLG